MKKLLLIISGLALLSACPAPADKTSNNTAKNASNTAIVVNNNTPNTVVNSANKTADLKAYGDAAMPSAERIAAIDAYVKGIEKRLPPDLTGATAPADALKRKETDVSKDVFKDVTDEKWVKMDTYYDGEKLMRLKVYSPENEKKTEEFYFHDEKPVFSFIENDGMSKKGDSAEAKGDKFYFGSEGMFAMIKADNTKVDAASEEFKKYKEKLPKEANEFRKGEK